MKKYALLLALFGFATPSYASPMNLDPYFGFAVSSVTADIGGDTSRAPGFNFIAGSSLNWISSNLGAELRIGFGGQYTTFNGDLRTYTSYLLKPSIDISHNWNIYALLGYSTVSVTVSGQRDSDVSPSGGLGFKYRIPDESLSVTTEWLSLHKASDSSTTAASGLDLTAISLAFEFQYD